MYAWPLRCHDVKRECVCVKRECVCVNVCVRQTLNQLLEEWARYFNSNPFDPVVVHCCHPSAGCACAEAEDPIEFARKRMIFLLRRVAYRRMPRVPRVKEWTALCQFDMSYARLFLLLVVYKT